MKKIVIPANSSFFRYRYFYCTMRKTNCKKSNCKPHYRQAMVDIPPYDVLLIKNEHFG